MEIGRGHRLALTSRLVALDEALCEFERWAQGHAAASALYEEKNDLTPAQRQAILEQVLQARAALAEMVEAFGLDKQTQPVRRSVVSQCAVLWELLTELEPRYLSRYGAVDEELAARVTEGVEELRQRIVAIGRAVAGQKGRG
jgi:hypothetical protein